MNSSICRYGAPIRNKPIPPHIKPEWVDIARRYAISAGDIYAFAMQCEMNSVPVPDARQMEEFVAHQLATGFDIGAAYLMMMRWRSRVKQGHTEPVDALPGIVPADWEEE